MSDNIKVTVRVRPFIKRELGDAAPASHWDIQDDHGIVQVHPASCKPLSTPYIFDDVFGPDMQNEDVYREVAMPIIESALTGFNGTIFVYGQTSSGKTFTMMGDRSSPGIVPLAVQNIFRIIEDTPDREYLIRASYMEIYNENISDLLAGQDTKGRSLNIREDLSGAVYVGDLKEEYANCEEQLLKIIKRGEKNRHTASTNMNERSSRSHTIFRLILESRERGDEAQEEGAVTVSHLNLVDLAGSENASQSGATGERLREGGFINKSLFMLGRVISQLSEGESFVNFRDSKLTRILQTSLGGNSKTAIICTVTPAAVEQTHSTLRFASRAKAIKNKPVVNEVLSDAALLKRYAREIKALQHTLALERNTDKNQEVEQVREMFEEQARRNEELQAKVMELQTKLVVSSLPRGCPRNPMDKKKKKARRETWCAPAIRNSRMSLGHPLLPTLPSCVEEHKFVQPRLPPWTETSICSESACSDTSLYNIENSLSQEEFGKDDISFVLNQAEKSKLDRQDFLPQDSPYMVNTSRRKKRRVKFDVAPSPPQASDIGCQTEESLMPQMRLFAQSLPSTPQGTPLSVKLPGTPSTPSHVLRARNQELRDKLREKEDWLSDWQREMETLKEFHRLEIKTLEESFDGKVAAFTENHPRLEASAQETEHLKEIASLRRSVQDYEQLLMDANRELSLNVQNSADLQRQLETLSEENIQLSGLQEEVVKLRDENKMLKKDLEVKECRLSKCENERNDFDMEMELALEKQKQKEAYLQNNLEEAWKEIAAYEKGDVEEVKKNWQRLAELELMVSTATTAQGTTQSSDALDQQLVKVQQEADELRVELLEVSQQMEQVKKENDELRQEVKDLQEHLSEVLSRQGSDRILSLKEEVENLKKRLEEAEKIQQHKVEGEEEMRLSPPIEVMSDRRGGEEGSTMVSQDFSRALSETIQALEESICVATPGRHSFGTWLDNLSPRDLEAARPLVETLKAGLSALQEHMQVMEQQQQETAYATDHCLQIAAEMEKELNTWKIQESFIGDYVLHAISSRQPKQSSTHACPSPPHGKSEEAVHKAVEEACSQLKAEYEAKLTAFENRGRFNSKSESLYFSFSLENDTPSGVPGQSERREDTMLDASFFSLGSHFNNTEVKELKGQLELLTQENSELLNLVKALQDAGNATPLAAAAVEGKTRTPPDTCISEPVCPEGKCALDGVSWEQEVESANPSSEPPSATPQSLADELRQAGMNLTMLNETFETSVVVPASVTNPNSDTLELRQQLCVLEQEKVQLQDKVCSLQDTLRQMKEKKSSIIEKSAEEETVYIDQLESEVQRLKEECLTQTTHIKTLQDEMNSRNSVNKIEIQDSTATIIEEEKMKSEWKVYELEEKLGYQNFAEKEKQEEVNHLRDQIKKLEEEKLSMETKLLTLEEKLSCMSLIEEELHSLQWQVTTLKEEKSVLEKELIFMQDEVEKLTEQNEQLSYKTECKAQVEADGAKESNAGPTSDHADTEIENASVLQQKTKELEEAKEEIEVLKQEVEKMHRVSEESCADVKNEDNAKEVEEKIMELQESKEKIEYLKEEIEKVSAKCQNELAEKENELEMMITNFMEKEEAFENTEKQLKRANIDLKDSLANKDLELQNIRNKHEEEYVKVTAELEEMKKTLIKKDLELQRVNSQLDQMKAEADHMPDNKVMSELEENLQTLKQEYVDLQAQSEEKLVKAQASVRKFEEKYNSCLQDYIAASQACEENRLMLIKSEEEKEILKEKLDSEVKRYEEEKGALQLKYENERHKSELEKENHESKVKKYEEEKENLWLKYGNELQRSELEKEKHESEVKKYEEERENLRLRYENELQQSEEEKENLTVKYKCEIQKHVEQKENLKLKYESEIASATAAGESRSREALGFSVQSTMEQKLDEMETLKDSLEEKVKECDCLKDTVDNLKVVLGKKQEELLKLTAEHQEEVAFYVDNLSEKEKVAKDLENETRRRSEEVASLTSALTAKDHRLHRLEKDLANTQKELEDKETELHDGMDRLRKDYEEVCAEKSRMSEDMRSLEEAKETITYKCSSLRAQLDNLEEDFLQIKEELEAGKKEIQLKQEVICSLEAAQERLKEELDSVRTKETELLDQQVTSSHKIEKLLEEIEKYKCEMFEKENQIVAISEDLASKTGSSERLAKDLQELHEQLEDKCREQEEAERRCEVLEEKLERSMAEADKMQGQIMQLSAAKDKILIP
ncbi:hypothetical protein O3P69_016041 [Scylla paramamosain]|uniref:Kinesin motor domain-containing protein n=3 Tax=Scylla paramamosain TaxID=85552 RepID=A0AAW0T8W9_SCYPA